MSVEETLQLGVGRLFRRGDIVRIQHEEGQVAALELIAGDHGAIGLGRAKAGADAAGQVRLGDLVARDGLEGIRGQSVFAQDALIGVVVELAGDLVEEVGLLCDGVAHQRIGRHDAHPPRELAEGFSGAQIGQHLPVKAGRHRVLQRHRLALLLLHLLQVHIERALELGWRNLARSGGHHRIRYLAVEHVSDAPDGETDDEQRQQHHGDR